MRNWPDQHWQPVHPSSRRQARRDQWAPRGSQLRVDSGRLLSPRCLRPAATSSGDAPAEDAESEGDAAAVEAEAAAELTAAADADVRGPEGRPRLRGAAAAGEEAAAV